MDDCDVVLGDEVLMMDNDDCGVGGDTVDVAVVVIVVAGSEDPVIVGDVW